VYKKNIKRIFNFKKEKNDMKKILIQTVLLSIVMFFASCSSTAGLIETGYAKLQQGNNDKAEAKFTKALEKKTYKDNAVIDKAYHGLSMVASNKGNYSRAKDYEYKAHQINNNSFEYAYNLAKFNAQEGDTKNAYNWLFYLGDISARGYGSMSSYGQRASTDPFFSALSDDNKFQRFCAGYRRLNISILRGYSSESDKFTENDQFATVSAVVNSGDRKVVLCTNTIDDDNSASWSNQRVVFDYKLGTSVKIAQFDEDYTSHDLLSSYTGSIPYDLNLTEIKGDRSGLQLSVQDTEQGAYTSGTSIPSTISPTLVGIAVAGAIVYGASELAYSGVKNMSSSSRSNSSAKSYSSSYTSNSSNSASYSNSSSSNTSSSNASKNTVCYSNVQEYSTAYVSCNDSKYGKSTIYKVTCGNGSTKYYYYNPQDQSEGLCMKQKGYYEHTNAVFDGDYLGKDYEKAMKKLCNCNN
jgi:hypothetical protein